MEGIPGAPGSGANGLIERVKAIVMKPKETWPIVAGETTSPGDLFTRYVVPLAAIGPIASFIGGQIFGFRALFVTYRPGLMSGLTSAIVTFVMALISYVVIALISDFLAPKFEGKSDRGGAFRLVAYSLTPGWVAGILGLIPGLSILAFIAACYGIYLFFLGSKPVMKVPEDKGAGYTAVTIVCAIIAMFIASVVTSSVAGLFGGGLAASSIAAAGSGSGDNVEVSIPGVGKIDTSKIEQATKQMEQAANGQTTPVDMEKLKALLPATLGSYTRSAVDTGAVGALGKGVSATYTNGDKSIELKVLDSAGLGALAGLAGAMGAEQSHEDANGYEKTTTVNGQMQTEKWDNSASSGEFGQQINSRFFISAEGKAGSIDELKAAVASIDQSALAGLAK